MRHLLFDEISAPDMEKVRDYMEENAVRGTLDDIYFVEFPETLLNDEQTAHGECKPFAFAVETGDNWIRMELLVRSRQTLHCTCIGYANREQLDYVLEFGERLISECDIRT